MPKSNTATPSGSSRSRAAWRPGRRSRRRASRRCRCRRPGSAVRGALAHPTTASTSPAREEQVAAGLAQQLLRRVVVDRHRDVGAVLVVEVEALDRRRAPVEHAVVDVARRSPAAGPPCAAACGSRRPSSSSSASPGVRVPRLRRRCRARRRSGLGPLRAPAEAGSAVIEAPVQRRAAVLGRRGRGALDHLPHRRVLRRRSPRARRR